ncbi:MAG: amidohydrolase family protein [Acidobacteria bacterium]|nr:amidohydrolase family protein [Acidobacteriota bacterium]
MRKGLMLGIVVLLFNISAWTQQADLAARLGSYPQTIIYNGKIVTMDDRSFASQVGTIVQAMAIRDGKILRIGNNADVRALAGPQTKQIDLKGRTVLPSFILTHEHPTDWAFQEPRALTHVLPNDDFMIHRWMPNLPPKEQLARLEPMLKEALGKAKPGQPILLSFNWGPDEEWAEEMIPLHRNSISKEYLDQLAPNNPVKVKNGFITSYVNQMALDGLRKVHPKLEDVLGGSGIRGGPDFVRPLEPDSFFRGRTDLLAQLLNAEMELWASYGTTTIGSATYAFGNLHAMHLLAAKGEMSTRFGYSYRGHVWDVETLRALAGMLGHGTDHLWFIGAFGSSGGCMSVTERAEWAEQEGRSPRPGGEGCGNAPGTPGWDENVAIAESGLRFATMHTSGDKGIDYVMDAIEEGSKRAGLTPEQIRAKRHAFDHSAGAPRPQQIPRIKNLGMMVSQLNTILWETHRGAHEIAKQYGLEYTNWVVPRKSLTDAGVMNTSEIDRPIPFKSFFFILKGMNRYNDRAKMVYGPGERTDRITQLKALTQWGSHYMLRENLLGSLEPDKFADFIVLDKDFLTIPEDQIPTIQVLMTVVGGKPVHLASALAREVGMSPVGPSTWDHGKVPAGWGPPPPVTCGYPCSGQQ